MTINYIWREKERRRFTYIKKKEYLKLVLIIIQNEYCLRMTKVSTIPFNLHNLLSDIFLEERLRLRMNVYLKQTKINQ